MSFLAKMAPVQILIYFFFFVKISKSYPPILFLFSKNFLYIKKNFKKFPPKKIPHKKFHTKISHSKHHPNHKIQNRTKNSTQKIPYQASPRDGIPFNGKARKIFGTAERSSRRGWKINAVGVSEGGRSEARANSRIERQPSLPSHTTDRKANKSSFLDFLAWVYYRV